MGRNALRKVRCEESKGKTFILTMCAELTSMTRWEISRSKDLEKTFYGPYSFHPERTTSENSKMAKPANPFHHVSPKKKHSSTNFRSTATK
jgi:hypothetical protein